MHTPAAKQNNIFEDLFAQKKIADKYTNSSEEPVDVVMPLFHANAFLSRNINSYYRELPINNFIVSIDSEYSQKYVGYLSSLPRVKILDHRSYKTLGFSIKKLIESVGTEWFVYLHSDVFLPSGWYKSTQKHRKSGDFIETNPHLTILLDFEIDQSNSPRSFSGAQMGRSRILRDVTRKIEDDYLYRNEDIVISELLKMEGYKYHKANDVFHVHEVMHHDSPRNRKMKNFSISWDIDEVEDVETCMQQVKGIIKYLSPNDAYHLGAYEYTSSLRRLSELGKLNNKDLEDWIINTNPEWYSLHKREIRKEQIRLFFRKIDRVVDRLYYFVLKFV